MPFDVIYQYLFSSDVMEFSTKKGTRVLLRVGDRVSVYSKRFSQWFDDGIIVATFRASIKVRYGFQRYFGSAWSRGNEKYVYVKDIMEIIRPHHEKKDDGVKPTISASPSTSNGLRLVCPAATTIASVPSR